MKRHMIFQKFPEPSLTQIDYGGRKHHLSVQNILLLDLFSAFARPKKVPVFQTRIGIIVAKRDIYQGIGKGTQLIAYEILLIKRQGDII